ncbi:hypothetical protein [Sutterella parvirubra]|uniref:hypothetical protein n=1 Tax=Sutterella parvirubra TaxID=437898 RepID=UPI0012F679E5|nr:hypothetical protein [Sutterella parvirubra]
MKDSEAVKSVMDVKIVKIVKIVKTQRFLFKGLRARTKDSCGRRPPDRCAREGH